MSQLPYRNKTLPKGEGESIQKMKLVNEQLDDFFKGKREELLTKVDELVSRPRRRELSSANTAKIVEEESLCLSYRADINNEISKYLNKLSSSNVDKKEAEHDKTIFYISGASGFKLSATQSKIMVESVCAEKERNCELIESYIEFLRGILKDLETFAFTIKNTIALLQLLNS